MSELVLTLDGEAATQALGAALAKLLPPGSVVALEGPLGAGKTRIAQGLAEGLGVSRAEVTSPTFVLLQHYHGRRVEEIEAERRSSARPITVHHFDAYRLKDADEFTEIGGHEYLASDGICLIEWASRVASELPADRLNVTLEIAGPLTRRAVLSAHGTAYETVLQALPAELASR